MLNLVSNKQYLPEITNLLDVTDKIDVPGTTDNVDLPYGMDQVDVHDSTPDTDGLNISESFASQSSSVKHDLTDQLNTNRHQKLEIPAGAPEMSYSKKFVFKPKKPSSSEEKLPETKKFYDLTMFEYLGNGEPLNVESETKMVPEKLDVSEEAYSSAVDVLRNDGRKVVPRSVSKTKRFSTPRQKVSNASSDSPATGKNALKVYEVLSLSNIESFRSGLSITDCLIDRDLRNLLEYKQNILNQAVTLSKLVIAPAYSTFCQRHLREYFRQNLNPGIQEQFKLSPEAYFSRLGYLTFSGLKLLKHSPQHDKFVSKLMPLKFDICFYIGFPAKKHLFNNFNKNDIWAIILNRSFVVNSGVDGMKILLARSMMPWPLWNGHLQVQVIATFGGQAHDIKGQKSNEVSPKSVFGLTCYNSSFCVIRICQAVNELDCVSVVQECFPEIPYLEPSCVPNELPGLLQGLCNPMKNTRSSKTSQDVLIESCNFDKAFSLAGKVATEFQLNESQKKALVQFCSSLCSLEHKNFSTLIHGVFGSGKSLFLAVLCHFVTTLLDQNLLLDSKFSLLICSGTNVAVDNVLIKYLDIAFAETKQG